MDNVRSLLYNKQFKRYYRAPYIKSISKREYKTLTKQERKYFDFESASNSYECYVFSLPLYYLMVRVKQRIVTHVQDINPELESEKVKLGQQLEPYWRTCRGGGRWHYFENRAERRYSKVKTKQLCSE